MIDEAFRDALRQSGHIRFSDTLAYRWRGHYHRDGHAALAALLRRDDMPHSLARPRADLSRMKAVIEPYEFGRWTSFVEEDRVVMAFSDHAGAILMGLIWE